MRLKTRLAALIAGSLLASTPLAGAQAAARPAEARAVSKQQAADEKAVREVWDTGGFEATERQRAALIRALDHAPPRFPTIEQVSPTTTVVRAYEPDGALTLVLVAALTKGNGGRHEVKAEFNTYPVAALLLGAYAVEKNRPAEALAFLERGLALQPDDPLLLNEKAAAFEALRQPDKALAALEPWLATDHLVAAQDRARLLRAKGFALVELNRLPEAQAAYLDSLKVEPGHPGAQRELAYIEGLQKGKAPTAIGLQTSDKAAAGGTVEPLPAGETPKS